MSTSTVDGSSKTSASLRREASSLVDRDTCRRSSSLRIHQRSTSNTSIRSRKERDRIEVVCCLAFRKNSLTTTNRSKDIPVQTKKLGTSQQEHPCCSQLSPHVLWKRGSEMGAPVIQETVALLLRVQHLQKGTCRIPIDASTNLVHLVDQHQRVLGPHSLERLHDLARQRAVELGEIIRYAFRVGEAYPT